MSHCGSGTAAALEFVVSIVVELADLASVLAGMDPGAFLCTASATDVKAMHVLIEEEGGRLTATVGGGTVANVVAGSSVTLVFPGSGPHDRSLLVDARAVVRPGDPPVLEMTPTAAVWHRSAHGVSS